MKEKGKESVQTCGVGCAGNKGWGGLTFVNFCYVR